MCSDFSDGYSLKLSIINIFTVSIPLLNSCFMSARVLIVEFHWCLVVSHLWLGHEFLIWHGRNSHSQSLLEFCRIRSFCPQSAHGPPCDHIRITEDVTLNHQIKLFMIYDGSVTLAGISHNNLDKWVRASSLDPYLSSWHMSRFSLSSGVRRRVVAPSSSVLMSELSCWLQRVYLWTPATAAVPPIEPRTESPLDSPVSAPETEMLPVAPAAPDPLEPAVPAPASAPSGLLSEGQTAVILQGMPRVAWA